VTFPLGRIDSKEDPVMSLLTVNLEDICPIDCGKWGVFKRRPRYRLFLLLKDSFLLGKHEVCLTNKEIFGGSVYSITDEMYVKGRNKFFQEVFGPYLDPWKREETVKQVLSKMDERHRIGGVSREIVVSVVREDFDEVHLSDITGFKLRRNSLWSNMKTIDMTFQGRSVSLRICEVTALGVQPNINETQATFVRIQKRMEAYRR
jgi:hypothetical protein